MTLQVVFSSPAAHSQAVPSAANPEPRAGSETVPFEEVLKETRERKKSETDGLEMAGSAAGQLQNFASAAVIPNDDASPGAADGPAAGTCISAAAPALPDAGKVAALLTGAGQPADLSGQNVCPADVADGQVQAAGQAPSAAPPATAAAQPAPQPGAEADLLAATETAEPTQDTPGVPEELKRAVSQSYASTLEDGQTPAQEVSTQPALPAATPTRTTNQPAQSPVVAHNQSAVADPLKQSQDAAASTAQTEKMKPDAAQSTPVSPGILEKVAAQPAAASADDLTRLADVRSRELVQQVAQHVEMTLSQGKNSLRIQLFPADMGRIDLRVTGGPNGLVVSLVADQPATNQALMKQLDQIRQTLMNAGIQLSDLHIGGQPGQSSYQSSSREPGRPSYRGPASRKEVSLDPSELPILADGSAGIDYRI